MIPGASGLLIDAYAQTYAQVAVDKLKNE